MLTIVNSSGMGTRSKVALIVDNQGELYSARGLF